MIRYRYNLRHDGKLRLLFEAGYTVTEIAGMLDQSYNSDMIRRQCVRLGLVTVKPHVKPEPVSRQVNPDPTSPVEAAKVTLNQRVTERNGSYWLDGRQPVGIKGLIEEANRVREGKGMPPIVMKRRGGG